MQNDPPKNIARAWLIAILSRGERASSQQHNSGTDAPKMQLAGTAISGQQRESAEVANL